MVAAKNSLVHQKYSDEARRKLQLLASSLELPPGAAERMAARWQHLVGSWASMEVADAAPWSCGISDDASPFEFSVVLDERAPELRVLWETPGESDDLSDKMSAGLASHRRLMVGQPRAAHRFDRISDLFLPPHPQGVFVVWHAARLWPMDEPELKVYLNPQARGRERSTELVREALSRLGLGASWQYIEQASARGEALDEIRYFSLDLRDEASARIKIYVYHREPTSEQLARVAALSPFAEPERIAAFFERVTGGRTPAAGFCPGSCLSFVAERGAAPTAVTLHVPVRAYVNDDNEACRRVAALAEPGPIGANPLGQLLSAKSAARHREIAVRMAERRLDSGVGLTTYVSLRSERGAERVTCYLATELFGVQPPR